MNNMTKKEVIVYAICIVLCFLLFYFTLNSAKKREREESIEIEATKRYYKKILVENGKFYSDGKFYKVTYLRDANDPLIK